MPLVSDHPPSLWPELSALLCTWAGGRPEFTWGSRADLGGTHPGKEIIRLERGTVTLFVRVKNFVCLCVCVCVCVCVCSFTQSCLIL